MAPDELLLITFEDEAAQKRPTPAPVPLVFAESVDDDALRQLESELKATREDLQSTIDELETSNEKLKGSIEEIKSMNEELQSSNEELETSKEELQSLNEELATVNAQLQEKVEALENASNDMTNLLNCRDIATVCLDKDFRIKLFTPVATRLFSLIASDIGRPLGDITPRFSDPALLDDAQRVLENLVPREKEVSTADGSWWSRRVMPFRTKDNRIDGVIITCVDITDGKRSADAVRRLAVIAESSADAIFSKDLAGTIQTWNQGAERLYGYSREEATGRSVEMLFPAERAREFTTIMAQVAAGESVDLETERLCKDGRRVPVQLTISPVRDASGKVVSVSTIARDISVAKRAEAALRESERRLTAELAGMSRIQEVSTLLVSADDGRRLLLEIVDAAIAITHADMGNIQLLDPDRGVLEIEASRGFEKPFLDYFKVVERGHASCGASLLSGSRTVVEDVAASPLFAGTPDLDVMLAAGARAVVSTPLVGRSGTLVGILSIHHRNPCHPADRDLSVLDLLARQAADWIERVRADAALRQSEERFRAFTNATFDVVYSMNPDWTEMRHLYGRELIADTLEPSRTWLDKYIPLEERQRLMETINQAIRTKSEFELEHQIIRADGTLGWTHTRAIPILDDRGEILEWFGAASDVTERKRSEQAIHDRDQRLSAILNTAADAIITIDRSGTIQSVNPATERMFGYNTAEMVGQNVSLLMPSPYREEHDGYLRRYRETGEARMIGIGRELHARNKDGSIFPVELSVSEVDPLEIFTGMIRDITRRKVLEREIVEIASLEQRRIGQDLHDTVSQELTALNVQASDLAEMLQTAPANVVKLVERISQGVRRSQQELRALMRGLLPVSVETEGLMVALSELAERTQKDTKATCNFDCTEPVSVGDNLTATHLYLIAQEAVHNALKHARPQNIRISLKSNDFLRLAVEDDGVGIPAVTNIVRAIGGLGMRIMRNRAAIIGATLVIEGVQPTGTRVLCIMPRRKNAEAQDNEAIPDRAR
jgi:PAS domain S-box-containing protein